MGKKPKVLTVSVQTISHYKQALLVQNKLLVFKKLHRIKMSRGNALSFKPIMMRNYKTTSRQNPLLPT